MDIPHFINQSSAKEVPLAPFVNDPPDPEAANRAAHAAVEGHELITEFSVRDRPQATERVMPQPADGPFFARPVPESWPGLIARAEEHLVKGVPDNAQTAAVAALFSVIPEISREEHATARYYGYGKILCGIAQAVAPPAERDKFVGNSAEYLVEHHVERCATATSERRPLKDEGLHVNEVINGTFGLAGQTSATIATYKAMPLAERLVINTLHNTSGAISDDDPELYLKHSVNSWLREP